MFDIESYCFNLQAIPLFFVGASMLLSGLFVYSKNRSSSINKVFLLICISVCVWLLATALGYLSKVPEVAKVWFKIDNFGVIFISINVYFFIVLFLDVKRKLTILLGYLTAVLFGALITITDFLVIGVKKYFWGYFPEWGFLGFGVLLFFFGFMLASFIELVRHYRIVKAPLNKKNQIKYMFIAFLGAYTGSVDYLPAFGVEVYPFGYISIAFFLLVIAYSMVKYRLMDIEVVIRKTLIFGTLFVAVLGSFVGITLLTQELIVGGRLLGVAISSLIIILSIRPLEDFLVNITDKYLFQKKYDYQQVLKSFIDKVITEFESDKIASGTIDLLDKTLHPERIAIFLFDKNIRGFILIKGANYDTDIMLEDAPEVLSSLISTKDILSMEIENGNDMSEKLTSEMNTLNAVLAIPLIASSELLGVILLGKKKSDEYYTEDDMNILMDLARTESIAIKNSQTLQELTEQKKIAALGKVASSLSHNINNHLNRARIRLQKAVYTDQILTKLGSYDLPPEGKELIDKLAEHIKMVTSYIDAGGDVVKKARDFAKPTKGPLRAVDIRQPLEEAMYMVNELKFKKGTRKIPITLEIAPDVPKVRAKEDDLREVSITVIDNAVDAIRMKELNGNGDESDNIRIEVAYSKNIRQIELRVIDTGIGIKEQELSDIFLPYFTTKGSAALYEDYARRKDLRVEQETEKAVYGTGLGLDLVKSLVEEQIRGKIRAESKQGEGATFIITIPEWVEDENGEEDNGSR